MTVKSLAQKFSTMTSDEQAVLVARWLHLVTIDARDTYIPGTLGIADPVRLRGFNEFLHRISNQLLAILTGEQGYPDDEFLEMLIEAAGELHAEGFRVEFEKWGRNSDEIKPRKNGTARRVRVVAHQH
jgi:hypothetical protein